MAQNSVDAFIDQQPEVILSKDEYWQDYKKDFYKNGYDGIIKAPGHYNDINYNIAKFFGHGAEKAFEAAYEAYLNNVNNRNERIATQNANAYSQWLDDTKYQRMFKDFEKAGLNPYLLVNNGSFSATAPTSAKASYQAKQSAAKQASKINLAGIGLLLLGLAKVAAALL